MPPDSFFKPLSHVDMRLGPVSRPKADEAPVEEDAPPPVPVAPAEKPKPKTARLFNPRWEAEKVGFNEETPISVELDLPPEVAHKKRVTFELFAKTPKGPERISQGEAMAEDGKATLKIPVYIPNYRDEDGNNLQRVEYYFTAQHSEAQPLDGSKAPKVVDEMAERVLEMHILQSLTFATGKSFSRTSQAGGLKALGQAVKEWKGKHSDGKLAVFGHADAAGEELSNKQLSERRAKSVYAFLAKDAKSWEELYGEERWGLAAVQELLKHLGHDAGVIDGQDGPKTQAAVKDFQGKRGLGATGMADAKTREALFTAYFESNGTPACGAKDFDVLDGKAFTGCSEFNLMEKTNGACEPNRRVAVLLLKVSKNFPIHYPCKQGAILPCQKQAGLKGERRTAGFQCRFYDKLVVERRGPQGAGKIKPLGFEEGENLKQYVNLPAEEPSHGRERIIEVEAEGLADGDPIYWTVTAGKKNSLRTDPKTGIKESEKGELKEFIDHKATLVGKVKAGKCSLVVSCGVAGGDQFEIEVGLAKDKADKICTLTNWRRLSYEIYQPLAVGNGSLTDYTVFNADKSPGLPEKSKSYLAKELGKCFIEFEPIHADTFGPSELSGNAKHNILDAGYLQKDKGKKALVVSFDQLRSVLDKKAKHRKEKRTVSMVWCDYLADMVIWKQSFPEISGPTKITPGKPVFPSAIDACGNVAAGDFPITRLIWNASHWFDQSADGGFGEWKPIRSAEDPGGKFLSGGVLTSEEDIRKHLEFIDMYCMSLRFPDTRDSYPGKKVPKNSEGRFTDMGSVIGLTVQLEGVACRMNTNGAALKGDIWMNTFAGEADPVGMAAVIAHELGHNMGQAYGSKTADGYFGRPMSKPIPGFPFPAPVPHGFVYGGHAHQGTHCARGISDRTAKSFQTDVAFKERTCVMFGASDLADSFEYSFCPDCNGYIRAENLEDVRKSWTV